ncbi:MAG: hypothetical protein WBF43_05610, partial [Methylocella sp.]
MANDDKQPGSNLASGSVILVALVATGTYFFHREAPLLDSRPAVTVASTHEQSAPQTIDARLWQDPFEAVDNALDALDKPGKRTPEQQCPKNPSNDSPCNSPLTQKDKETLVIGVTVSGAPYFEDAEQRRRTRYAVLAGLERAGFVPRDARRIGYFWWTKPPPSAALQLPPLALSRQFVLYQQWWDRNRPAAIATTVQLPPLALSPLLQLYRQRSNLDKLAATATTGQLPPVALSRLLQLYQQWLDRNEPAAIATAQKTFVPYEWFQKASQRSIPHGSQSAPQKSILVLWLREEDLKEVPLRKISALKASLKVQEDQNIKIIGPFSSDILYDMANEARPWIDIAPQRAEIEKTSKRDNRPDLKNVQFYAYGASAPDSQLLGNLTDTVQSYFNDRDINLQRTIATDDTLAYGMVTELKRRKVNPGHAGGGDLALISEWDTFYGQTLPQAVERQFALGRIRPGWHRQSRDGHRWINKFTYLRGLDGQLPLAEGTEDRKRDKATTQGEKQTSAPDFFKIETDTKTLERPIGQGQFDYLRRISEHLHKIDDKLRRDKPASKISAIGILGSDVFDKLLILRALRPGFPEALFFTTDFDEAFTITSELPFTRNLIISSSFGPNLGNKFQGEIPFFRDTYQTSAFLATLLAIGDPDSSWVTPE